MDSDKEDDIAELKTASDLMVLLLLGGELYDADRRTWCQIFKNLLSLL